MVLLRNHNTGRRFRIQSFECTIKIKTVVLKELMSRILRVSLIPSYLVYSITRVVIRKEVFFPIRQLDYEQSLCFLKVRRERSEKNRPRESCCLGERRKKGTTVKVSAFDLSRPSDFMVFISNLINRNPIISLILTASQFWSVVMSSLSSLSSISQSHFCVVGATHKSNAEALSVVPFFRLSPRQQLSCGPLSRGLFFSLRSRRTIRKQRDCS